MQLALTKARSLLLRAVQAEELLYSALLLAPAEEPVVQLNLWIVSHLYCRSSPVPVCWPGKEQERGDLSGRVT